MDITSDKQSRRFPIRILAELTGVPPTTLRAWERRYGLLAPQRTPSGHRAYSSDDVITVKRIRERLDAGETISHAVRALASPREAPAVREAVDPWETHRQRLISTIERFDAAGLEFAYSDMQALFPADTVAEKLLRPVITRLGARWAEDGAGIAEEHFFSAFLRNKLGARLHHQTPSRNGTLLLAACLPGERHEFGLLLFALAASSQGYAVLYLGADLPLDEAGHAARRAGVQGLVLSSTRDSLGDATPERLSSLSAGVPMPVCLGGPLADRHGAALEELGIVPLGGDHAEALSRLGACVPPYAGRR